MSETERLSQEFAAEYLDKIFYFCLRKCGDDLAAEDLASEISLCVLTELAKGTVPDSFSAWVWRIARNRYARYVKRRQRDRAHLVPLPQTESGEELLDDGSDFAQEMAESQQSGELLRELRRALAFIRKDYRQILVAYYIENKPVSQIAEKLGIPEGTVKTKLFRSRIILKEGMDMAREFGKRSYNPEQIRYLNVCNRPGKMGQPWVLMDPKLHQNIFLACYDNPMKAEDLAIEVGVALPYMEDILERLSAQTLLIKEKDKYETAFPILSRGAQRKIHDYYADALPRLTARLEEYIDGITSLFQEAGLCYYGDYQSYDEAKWTLLLNSYKELYRLCENSPERTLGRTERPDFGQWDVVGFEKTDFSPKMVGFHCQLNHFIHYRFEYADICSRTPANLSGEETALLLRMVEGEKITDPADRAIADRLAEYGYAAKDESGYRPRVAVLSGKTNRTFEQFCAKKKRSPEFTEQLNGIKELVDAIFAEIGENNRTVREILVADLPARIRRADTVDPLLESIFADSLTLGYLVEQATTDGWLKYDDSTSPAVGAYFNLQHLQ